MIKKIIIGNEELNTALARYAGEPTEERYYQILSALAEAYDMGDPFFVAFEGDYFQSIRDEGLDYLVIFTDYDSAAAGPDTDLAVLGLEELIGNILSDGEMAGFVIDPFTDPVFIDRDSCTVIRSAALAGPYFEDETELTDLTPEEKMMLAEAMDDGAGGSIGPFPDEWGSEDSVQRKDNDFYVFDFSKGPKNMRS